MNKARRKWLSDIIEQLELQKTELESARDEEQEMYDLMPEGLQEAEQGQKMCENIDDLDNAISDLENVIDSIQEAIDR